MVGLFAGLPEAYFAGHDLRLSDGRADRDLPSTPGQHVGYLEPAGGSGFSGRAAGGPGDEPVLCLHRPGGQRLPAAGRRNGVGPGHRSWFQHPERPCPAHGCPGVYADACRQPGGNQPHCCPVPWPAGGLAGRTQPFRPTGGPGPPRCCSGGLSGFACPGLY